MAGWMDGWMTGWMDGWRDGWMAGWLAGWMGRAGNPLGLRFRRRYSYGAGGQVAAARPPQTRLGGLDGVFFIHHNGQYRRFQEMA
jgi:hypothetical protein